MPTTAKAITLADLSEEDRVKLLEQAREEAKHNPTDVEGFTELSPREQAIRATMDARDHFRGCPVGTGQTLGRVEGYDARRPPNPAIGEPERFLAVVRCIECGGSTVYDGKTEERPLITLEQAIERRRAELDADKDDQDL